VRLQPATGEMKAFPDPTDSALPWDITTGPDGKLWFTELAGRHVSKISVTGRITQYTIPGEYGIAGIAAGPDGRMWFTENDSGLVGSITVHGTVKPKYPAGSYPFGITAGPDGNMWFCVGYGDAIGRVRLPQ
jgi:virginiamycin B lyase